MSNYKFVNRGISTFCITVQKFILVVNSKIMVGRIQANYWTIQNYPVDLI